jgi:acyl-CoA hydrolase
MIKQTSLDMKIGRQLSRKANQPVEVTAKIVTIYNKSVWLIAVTTLEKKLKNRDNRKGKIVACISTRVEKKTKQKNTNIKKVKEKKEKKKKKKKKKKQQKQKTLHTKPKQKMQK